MVKRSFWNELGGMDEGLSVVMGDIDLCLRCLVADRYVVFTPDVQLIHEASSSRGSLDPLGDPQHVREAMGHLWQFSRSVFSRVVDAARRPRRLLRALETRRNSAGWPNDGGLIAKVVARESVDEVRGRITRVNKGLTGIAQHD